MSEAAPPIPAVADQALAGRTVLVTGATGNVGRAALACSDITTLNL